MVKQFSAAILALCLALALLPARALAADTGGTEYWVEMSANEARSMLGAVASKTESRYIVFVYYDSSTAANPVESQFHKYANDEKCYIYGYNSSTGGSLLDALAPLFDGSTALTLPVAVTWNPSTSNCAVGENVRTLNTGGGGVSEFTGLQELMEANGLGHGSSAPGESTDPGGTPPPTTDPGTSSSSVAGVSAQAWEVLRLLNIYRMEQGLQPLSTFAEVQQAANIRAQELFEYCSHTRPDGSSYETVFPEVGLALSAKITSWAENIASGQTSAADVMDSWKKSPGHNANMIKPTGRVHVGIGYNYQTNGTPSLYASNWVQNFVAAYDCSFTNLQLSQTSIEGKPGTDLETLLKAANIEVTATCYRHGKSSLPLIAAMCSGYNASSSDTQELTVTYGGQTATLTVAGTHDHTWTVSQTEEATCTEPGSTVYICTVCSATKAEVIPATGHSFTGSGDVTCGNGCGTTIPSAWKTVYEELTAEGADNKLLYPHGVEGIDTGASETTVKDYLEECIGNVIEKNIQTEYSFDILDGQFNADKTTYEYRIGIKAAASTELEISESENTGNESTELEISESENTGNESTEPESTDSESAELELAELESGELERAEPQAFSMLRAVSEDYILITEPLVLLLNAGSASAGENGEAPGVATPSSRPSGGSSSGSSSSYWTSSSASTPAPKVYSISAPQVDGGQVALDPSSASKGQNVIVTVQPDSGYELETLQAVDASGNEVELQDLGDGTYGFTMPASEVTLIVAFVEVEVYTEPELNPVPMAFDDVPSGSWYYSGVDYVWKHYLMDGVSDSRFDPEGTTSRAMLWTILARMDGVPTDTGATWYEQGQLWAVQQGVSDGTNPGNDVTREQVATMLWRDAGSPGAAAVLRGFSDGSLVSDYAGTAMCWAVENGIMQGAGGMLNPKSTASRAEIAVMIARYAAQAS